MVNTTPQIEIEEEKLEVVCECDDEMPELDDKYPPELELESLAEGEVGERVEIGTPVGTIRATWLGPVGEGPGCISLTEACRLMWDIHLSRQLTSQGETHDRKDR